MFLNTIELQAIIKERRIKGKGYAMMTLDLRKAFDSVEHATVERDLKRYKIDNNTRNYIMNNYIKLKTKIMINKKYIGTLQIKRGVKQGDPMSPIIFNLIMNELLELLTTYQGINSDGYNINCLAFADDLVIIAESVTDSQIILNKCIEFFKKRGLLN